jgi:hypothetical protein
MSCLLAKTIVAKWEKKKKKGSLPQKKNTNSML